MIDSCQNSGSQTENQRNDIGSCCHDCGVMKRLKNQCHNRFFLEITRSHISVQKICQPVDILIRKRGIQSHLCFYLGNFVGICKLSEHRCHRITRNDIQDKECDQRDREDNSNCEKCPFDNVSNHSLLPPFTTNIQPNSRRTMRRPGLYTHQLITHQFV